jgi:hypothetical protein
MKPFQGTHETVSKQSGRTPLRNERHQSRQEAQMNHSIHSADRATHLKIVVVALVACIAVAAFGIATRSNSQFTETAQTNQVVKAGKAVVITSSGTSAVR